MSEVCAAVRLPNRNRNAVLERVANRCGVAHDGFTTTNNKCEFFHYYIGQNHAVEAFVREALQGGFDARIRLG
jgi:hypothetical protein